MNKASELANKKWIFNFCIIELRKKKEERRIKLLIAPKLTKYSRTQGIDRKSCSN